MPKTYNMKGVELRGTVNGDWIAYIVFMANSKQRRERVGVIEQREVDAKKIRQSLSRHPVTEEARRLLRQRRDEARLARLRGELWQTRQEKEAAGAHARENSLALTFRAFVERFMREYASQRRSDHYVHNLAAPLAQLGDRPLTEIMAGDIERYVLDRRESFMSKWKKRISDSTIRKELTALGTVFRAAIRWKVATLNPTSEVRKPQEPGHRTMFLEDTAQWIRLLAELPPWLRPIATVGVGTGLRLKEIVGLQWTDIDRRGAMLYVRPENKTGKGRHVPLTGEVLATFDQIPRRIDSPFVFTDDAGLPLTSERTRNRISQRTRDAMKRVGVPEGGFHVLRHTYASWLVQGRMSLFKVGTLLGHKTPAMTQKYAHLAPGHLQEATEIMEGRLSEPKSSMAVYHPAAS